MMTTVQEIATAIAALSPDQRLELYERPELHEPDPFTDKIAADIEADRLDKLLLEAIDDVNNGRFSPL